MEGVSRSAWELEAVIIALRQLRQQLSHSSPTKERSDGREGASNPWMQMAHSAWQPGGPPPEVPIVQLMVVAVRAGAADGR